MKAEAQSKSIDREVEAFLNTIFKGIGFCVQCIGVGVRKLSKKKNLLIFGGCALLSVLFWVLGVEAAVVQRWQLPMVLRWCIKLLYIMPLTCLFCLGYADKALQRKYRDRFKDVAFIGKDGKAPYFIAASEKNKKTILIFKSNIPLDIWKSSVEKIQTALDVNVLTIEQGRSKKIVNVMVISTAYVVPTMIPWSNDYLQEKDGVVAIGENAQGKIIFDLNKTPHVLSAGETGSGKSVILRTMLWQLILQGCKPYMIDFKGGVEFGIQYEHFGEVLTERGRALEVLTMLVEENTKRLALFRKLEVKNLREYREKTSDNLCRVVVIIDEIAEMMDKTGVNKEDKAVLEQLEAALSTLARLSRATGINLLLGVQRPDAKVLPGQIKNNVPVRICGRFADKTASEIVLGSTRATELPDIKGRFLFKVGADAVEFQSYYFDDDTMLDTQIEVVQGRMLIDGDAKKAPAVSRTLAIPKESDKKGYDFDF